MHKCDHPPCCNPSHLECGTKSDNSQDMLRKKRNKPKMVARGEDAGGTKLTEADVLQIRSSNEMSITLAKTYNVTPAAIFQIRKHLTWKHI